MASNGHYRSRFLDVNPDEGVFLVHRDAYRDPVVFEEPWQTVKRYARAPEHFSIQEFSCFEGNRYRISEDGAVEIDFQ